MRNFAIIGARKGKKLTALAAVAGLGFVCTGAQAAVVIAGKCAQKAFAICTLQELYEGAAVFVGETAFWHWRFQDADDALADLNPSAVNVGFYESDNGNRVHLAYSSDVFWSRELEGNYEFRYDVMTKAGELGDRFREFGLQLIEYDSAGPGIFYGRIGTGFVDDLDVDLLDPTWSVEVGRAADSTEIGVKPVDGGTFAPLSSFSVATRVTVAGSPGSDFDDPPGAYISLNQFSQSFSRVDEPTPVALLLAAAAAWALRRRRDGAPSG